MNYQKPKRMYVDNKQFYNEMVEYIKTREIEDIEARKLGIQDGRGKHPNPTPIPDCIGKKIYDIVYNYSFNFNFLNYTYKDSFITEALYTCIKYADNFNPVISQNPFSYFTQIAWSSFVKVINLERKNSDTKKAIIEKYFSEELAEMKRVNKQDLGNVMIGKSEDKDFQPIKMINVDGSFTMITSESEWIEDKFQKIIKKYEGKDIPDYIEFGNPKLRKKVLDYKKSLISTEEE